MKPKSKMNDKPQAEINTVLVAVTPEAQTEHGHKCFGSGLICAALPSVAPTGHNYA